MKNKKSIMEFAGAWGIWVMKRSKTWLKRYMKKEGD